MTASAFFAQHAWIGGQRAADRVLIECDGERITRVQAGAQPPDRAVRLCGLALPGMANAHSHAFHRALRSRTHRGGGSFWTWREDMYALAAKLTPDSYQALARATYAEMALAGITCVGEFHYLHHDAGGVRYASRNAFGEALIDAAREAGIRITLLDSCYLAGGIEADGTVKPLDGVQLRFRDGDAQRWGERVSDLQARLDAGDPDTRAHARIGAAIHSVRAVPADQLATVARWAVEREVPLHFHVSEQRAENAACVAAHGLTPTALLDRAGALGARACAVHATHLSDTDIAALGASHTTVCMCPTTERDLADGIGPARALASAGAPLALGSDSHAVIDLLEETRALELDERLVSERRGHWPAPELLRAASTAGHAALGWPDAGRIEPGALADFFTLALDSVRTAGAQGETLLESAVFAAGAADVRDVVVGGRQIVRGGRHLLVGDVAGALDASIAAVWA